MLFMVIERFKDRDPIPVYKRVRDQGIKFPEGLTYVGSWIEPNFDRCFQLMECDDARLLQEWVLNCQGLGMTFEIVPVVALVRPPYPLRPDPFEVAEVFEVPLAFLLDERNHQRATRELNGRTVAFYVIEHQGRTIWGATAGMLVNLYRRIAA